MKVLTAEDDPVSRRVLEANLRQWGYEVLVATDGREAWEIINLPEAPNLVISDWVMPRMDGPALCRRVRGLEQSGYIYFILLTAKGEKQDVIKGLEAGADDFLTKPFDNEEFKYRIRIGERIVRLERRVMELANTDALTGVLNRRAFMERMNREILRSARENAPLSLLLIDIDHFKRVNDTQGHQAGDQVLKEFSNRLAASMRPYDFLGRYGGEEFVICLPGVNSVKVGGIAERMRRQIEEMAIVLSNGAPPLRVTASFGATSYRHESGEDMERMIKRADDALYRAKAGGRNRVCQEEIYH